MRSRLTRVQEIPQELYGLGYHSQCSIDFSPVAIENMREKCKGLNGLEWKVMDVRDLLFGEGSFDVAIDKVRVYELKRRTIDSVTTRAHWTRYYGAHPGTQKMKSRRMLGATLMRYVWKSACHHGSEG